MIGADGVFSSLLTLALGAIGGAAGTFVAMRTRLSLMARDIVDGRTQYEGGIAGVNARHLELEVEVTARVRSLERRQLVQLRLTADIARKVGVDGRVFDDALVRMLSEEIE